MADKKNVLLAAMLALALSLLLTTVSLTQFLRPPAPEAPAPDPLKSPDYNAPPRHPSRDAFP